MNNSTQNPIPRFTGLFIPVEILELEGLTTTDCMLLAWIDALQSKEMGGCYASNEHFCEKMGLKSNTITGIITKLEKMKLLKRASFDGRTRILVTCKENWFNPPSQSMSDVDLNQGGGGLKSRGGVDYNQGPSYIRDTSVDTSIEKEQEMRAEATQSSESSSSKSKVSEEALKTESEIINLMNAQNIPGWNAPKSHFLAHQCDILLRAGATYQQIILVVLWALESDWWGPKLFSTKTNPGTVIRKNFAEWFKSVKTPKRQGTDRRLRDSNNMPVENEHKHLF